MLFVQVLERGYQVNSKFYKAAPTFLVECKTKILNFPVSEREPPNQALCLNLCLADAAKLSSKVKHGMFFLAKQLNDIAKHSRAI